MILFLHHPFKSRRVSRFLKEDYDRRYLLRKNLFMSTADIDNLTISEINYYIEKIAEEQKLAEAETRSLNKRY